MVTIASAATAGCQFDASAGSAWANTRRSAPNAAAFTPADMSAVTVVGAPSYTSGAHMWNGTLATLNPNPTSSRPAPTSARPSVGAEATRSAAAIVVSDVLPLAP